MKDFPERRSHGDFFFFFFFLFSFSRFCPSFTSQDPAALSCSSSQGGVGRLGDKVQVLGTYYYLPHSTSLISFGAGI